MASISGHGQHCDGQHHRLSKKIVHDNAPKHRGGFEEDEKAMRKSKKLSRQEKPETLNPKGTAEVPAAPRAAGPPAAAARAAKLPAARPAAQRADARPISPERDDV